MAGSRVTQRHLGRKSSHRQALLRNLVASLFQHESITTTWPKAKEAQRMADKLITLGKRNTEAARIKAQQAFYEPGRFMPKLFGELRERYLSRPGGYTRVLRIEPEKEDQAPSAILQLVDGPRDMRFMMTAKTIAREQAEGLDRTDITKRNIKKVTTFRPEGSASLDAAVQEIKARTVDVKRRNSGIYKERVYERRKDSK
ncbi:MAG: hypothetical protein GOMPHAMPRED_004252 [Gomphillus americanus]|uniref:Large ribosomal subunit protein bL17m n=1 Tax=Gomphillus americanus TaxID=1940652 RepID=A0A8H3FLP3_9LECA|nr:MAG: hypothetical protein GOMPHAMPRED_004252 [Gomphillus americanus]